MKKLNNKGMTIIELLVCFVLVAIITASLYTTVSTYNNKKNEESYKEDIYKYKNLLTKEIYDDIIKKGLIDVTNYAGGKPFAGRPQNVLKMCGDTPNCTTNCSYYHPKNVSLTATASSLCNNSSSGDADNDMNNNPSNGNTTQLALIIFTFSDNTKKILQIATVKNRLENVAEERYGNIREEYYISYGDTRYSLPNLGTQKVKVRGSGNTKSGTIYDMTFSIKTVAVKNNIFYLDARFYHPELDEKYGIQITAPIGMDKYDRI